jgi:hypothetical protein
VTIVVLCNLKLALEFSLFSKELGPIDLLLLAFLALNRSILAHAAYACAVNAEMQEDGNRSETQSLIDISDRTILN